MGASLAKEASRRGPLYRVLRMELQRVPAVRHVPGEESGLSGGLQKVKKGLEMPEVETDDAGETAVQNATCNGDGFYFALN